MSTSTATQHLLEEYENQLKKSPNDFQLMVKILKHIRDVPLRRPDLVVSIGQKLLKNKSRLGDEYWTIWEQVVMGSLDLGQLDLAKTGIDILYKKFPGSNRVIKLDGLYHEAKGDIKTAAELYEKVLDSDPMDKFCLRRNVAICKSRGDIEGAIEELNEYLKTFMADLEAYQELADLYLSVQEYKKAAFCYEELILMKPYNYAYHMKYAEIVYTMGDIRLARKYFAKSLELNKDNNMRALWGLLMCTISLSSSAGSSSSSSSGASSDTNNAELYKWSEREILAQYKKKASHMLPIVKKLLQQQQQQQQQQ